MKKYIKHGSKNIKFLSQDKMEATGCVLDVPQEYQYR